MPEVVVPTLNANDESYMLVEWLVPDGAWVSAGDGVVSIETSKTITELTASGAGYLRQERSALTSCSPGDVIGHLLEQRDEATDGRHRPGPQAEPDGPDTCDGGDPDQTLVLTKPARDLADAHGISFSALASLSKQLIQRSDVEALITTAQAAVHPTATSQPCRLSAHQLAIARAVSRSHATIPAAFTVMKIPAATVLRQADDSAAGFIGIPEYVIKAVAEVSSNFPMFLAAIGDDLTFTLADSVDVGVTIDVGTGLFVPVIRAADKLSLSDIASKMMRFRGCALRSNLPEADLAGARIIVTLHQTSGILFARPIIYPRQACALALGALDYELKLGPSSEVERHDYFCLGIAYDHRVINGREAAAFLTAIRSRLE